MYHISVFARLFAIAAAFALAACAASSTGAEGGATERDPGPADYIKFSRGACFGACPTFALTLRGDGRLTFHGVRFTTISGQKTEQPGMGRFLDAIEVLKAHGFENFDDRYDRTSCKMAATDHPAVDIEVRTDEISKSLHWYTGCRGLGERQALQSMVDELERVLGVSEFVGSDAERQGNRR